jgi:hypothetical protein
MFDVFKFCDTFSIKFPTGFSGFAFDEYPIIIGYSSKAKP